MHVHLSLIHTNLARKILLLWMKVDSKIVRISFFFSLSLSLTLFSSSKPMIFREALNVYSDVYILDTVKGVWEQPEIDGKGPSPR
jgi:hypothetical protein